MKPHPWSAALLFAVITALTSCSSRKEEPLTTPMAFPEEEEESAYIPSYSKTVLAGWPKGRALDPHDRSRVRLEEHVHAYHVGRLPSHDRREMHEAHAVYRVEQTPRWDTRLPATPMRSRGVILGVIDPARNEIPKTTIIEQERQSLQAKSRQLEITMTRLNVLQGQLEKKLAGFAEAEQRAQELQEELTRITQDKLRAEAELKQAAAKIEELEANERFRLKSSSQGLLVPKKN
jgi:hypothetical protein